MNKDKVIAAIDLALDRIDKHFETFYDQSIKNLPHEHVLKFRDALQKMKLSVDRNILPNNYNHTLGKAIVDSWPYESEIGELIITAEENYYKYFRSFS